MTRLDAVWLDAFEQTFRLCGVQPGDACAVLSESRTRLELPALSMAALQRLLRSDADGQLADDAAAAIA